MTTAPREVAMLNPAKVFVDLSRADKGVRR